LHNLKVIGGDGSFVRFSLIGNPKLESIISLNNAIPQFTDFRIFANPNLNLCNIRMVCQILLDDDVNITIGTGNGIGCNSVNEILDQCYDPIVGKVYLDEDENGIDENEFGIPIGQIIYDEELQFFPDNNGIFKIAPKAGQVELEYLPENNWRVTTVDNFSFSGPNNTEEIKIGITPRTESNSLDASLSYSPLICDQT